MYEKKKIICTKCKEDTGLTEEGFRYKYLSEDVKCPHCAEVLIRVVKPIMGK